MAVACVNTGGDGISIRECTVTALSDAHFVDEWLGEHTDL